MSTAAGEAPRPAPFELGAAIREAREERGMSLRELSRRVGVSPSFVSQVERGRANPSVGTLYAVVGALGMSVDDLLGGEADRVSGQVAIAPAHWPDIATAVQRAEGRQRLQMSGVVWERLTHDHDSLADFLRVEYAPGSESCAPDDLVRHGGREYGHVLEGRLHVQVGFDHHDLGPGDSICFDSATPHRLANPHREPCTAVWFVLARSGDERGV